ncbi:D-beta-hydroxybutyrate dehydrogenase, mitochondrial-like [Palaemon carinicauda]|uniref:D-beta-hydroxybutyrate dehydrogenase, mitochondrial-like n=1 Tax=Palaemon carinicauda TaxID=392227 RepID=UPI0035B5BF1C
MFTKWNLDKTERVLRCGIISAVLAFIADSIIADIGCWTAFFILWFNTSVLYVIIASLQVPTKGRAVLITGCDTGFGLTLALHLNKLGLRVFAGCLFSDSSEGAKKLRQVESPTLHVLQLDVTSQDQIKKAVDEVRGHLPEGEVLWGIVNNAGVATYGEVEWVPLDTYRRMAEVNVFGVIAVTQAFLPMVRKAKGRVVNISSGLGRMAVPMRSPYVLTKYAVEGLNDVLRYEMKSWGVHVSIVEPGNYIAGTSIFTEETIKSDAAKMWSNMSEEVRSDYGEEHFNARVALMRKYATGGLTDLSLVINAFTEGLLQRYPQERYNAMDLYFKVRLFIATHLPEFFYDNIYIDYLEK